MREHNCLMHSWKGILALIVASLLFAGTALAQQASLSDSTIQSIIEKRLAKRGLPTDNIQVSVDDGVVTLSGMVERLDEKRQAGEAAQGIDDVMDVKNLIVLKPVGLSDQEIANRVAKVIRESVFYDIFDWVEGSVKDGEVDLSGYVREPWRKQDYERLVEKVAGVSEIENNLEVLPTSPMDDQIRVRASRLIFHHPMFAEYANRSTPPIHIIVKNGNILLKGVVRSQVEKVQAENLLRGNVLSFSVTNQLVTEAERRAIPR
ncbi:MAG: BON domain-containing protein [Acidobacteria bacterium]|nr:BON domain-containing protein [Acidobacteriota bacterium]